MSQRSNDARGLMGREGKMDEDPIVLYHCGRPYAVMCAGRHSTMVIDSSPLDTIIRHQKECPQCGHGKCVAHGPWERGHGWCKDQRIKGLTV